MSEEGDRKAESDQNKLISSNINYNVDNNSEWTPNCSQGQRGWKRAQLREIKEYRQLLKKYCAIEKDDRYSKINIEMLQVEVGELKQQFIDLKE